MYSICMSLYVIVHWYVSYNQNYTVKFSHNIILMDRAFTIYLQTIIFFNISMMLCMSRYVHHLYVILCTSLCHVHHVHHYIFYYFHH